MRFARAQLLWKQGTGRIAQQSPPDALTAIWMEPNKSTVKSENGLEQHDRTAWKIQNIITPEHLGNCKDKKLLLACSRILGLFSLREATSPHQEVEDGCEHPTMSWLSLRLAYIPSTGSSMEQLRMPLFALACHLAFFNTCKETIWQGRETTKIYE